MHAVRLAAWFHDAVYRPDRTENEERSAALAERALSEARVPEAVVAEVARLVRLTVTHDPADGDRNGEALCDADLAVLAGGPQEYGAYAARVREEYGFVPDGAFREGRSAVLRQLLALAGAVPYPARRGRVGGAGPAQPGDGAGTADLLRPRRPVNVPVRSRCRPGRARARPVRPGGR